MNNIKDSGRAVVEDGCIVIRVAIEALDTIIDGVVALYDEDGEPLFKVTDCPKFAADLVRSLNEEDEQGTTRIHLMFDDAIEHAVEYGAEGIEEK